VPVPDGALDLVFPSFEAEIDLDFGVVYMLAAACHLQEIRYKM
jgi:hypothetical protein